MRVFAALLFITLVGSPPAFAGKDDGVKAEDARRVTAQNCRMDVRYKPGCMNMPADAEHTGSTPAPRR